MTKTSGNVMGISQYNKKEKNMTRLGNMVWSEKSQNIVKSSLPEWTVIILPEEQSTKESCQNANNSIPVDDEDTVIPTESCSDVARDSEEIYTCR